MSYAPTSSRFYVPAVAILMLAAVTPARAQFALWTLTEVYTNNTGTLQFIEMHNAASNENFVNGLQIVVSNIGGSITNTFTIPGGPLPGDTANRSLLFGTAGVQAAGGPAPDFIIPNSFLFAAGGTINFFGANSGPYTALPTDGLLSRTWGGGNALNSPTNYAGVTGVVVPGPGAAWVLGCAGLVACRRRRRQA